MLSLDAYACPLIAVLRGLSPEEASHVGQALFDAGFRLLEVPLNRPGALEALRALLKVAPGDAIVGGGDALSMRDVDAIADAGGRMIASPNCDPAVIQHTIARGLLSLPGVATATEAFRALQAGAHGLKLFPAEAIPPFAVRALRSVLPSSTYLLPAGSIGPQDVAAYMAAGANGFAIGNQLYRPNVEPSTLKAAAGEFMEARAKLLEPESPP
jgi:2-dehydro-3-deoxyphosphogalactonate aldolase